MWIYINLSIRIEQVWNAATHVQFQNPIYTEDFYEWNDAFRIVRIKYLICSKLNRIPRIVWQNATKTRVCSSSLDDTKSFQIPIYGGTKSVCTFFLVISTHSM